MDEQHAKPKRRPPSRLGKGPTRGSWKPGQSGNPHGRVKHVLAFAERVRERVDPDLVIELALRVAEDERRDPAERLHALWPLVDRGWVKPPTMIAAQLAVTTERVERDWSALPLDERRELLERLRSVPRRSSSDDQGWGQPSVTDEERSGVHRLSTSEASSGR